jgi:hypothetical protein
MTPEEIFKYCPELRKCESNWYYIPHPDDWWSIPKECALSLAQARKEARELREQKARLLKTLNFYNYQDQHEMDNPGEWENRMNKVWGNKAIETIASLM